MHEASIALDILEVVRKSAEGRGPVVSVKLVLGALSGVCADSLLFCFTELAEQQGLGRPALEIHEQPVAFRCGDCGHDYAVQSLEEMCPACGSVNRRITAGYECLVESILVETE